jgi:O-antigen/teichoic acid export membrane protein
MLKKNVIANFIGQGWTALMNFIFIPIYVHYLGVESYGIIGFYATMFAFMTLFDFGLISTVVKEIAVANTKSHTPERPRDVVRTFECLIFGLALSLALIVYLVAPWLGVEWFSAKKLSAEEITNAIYFMGLLGAIRFVELFYRGIVVALQQQAVLNILESISALVKGVGAWVIFEFVSPSLQVFFLWQSLVSLLMVVTLTVLVYLRLPPALRPPKIDMHIVWSTKLFAGGMFGTAVFGFLFGQVDKLILSKLLTLEDFGVYSLASAVAGAIFVFVNPVAQAIQPRLMTQFAMGDFAGFTRNFRLSSALLSSLTGAFAAIMVTSGFQVMLIWTNSSTLANQIASLVALSTLGNLFSVYVRILSLAQYATGWTSLSVYSGMAGFLTISPLLIVFTTKYGVIGAAWVWFLLNLIYFFTYYYLVFRRILIGQGVIWLSKDIFAPAVTALGVTWLLSDLPGFSQGAAFRGATLLAISALSCIAALLTIDEARRWLFRLWKRWQIN